MSSPVFNLILFGDRLRGWLLSQGNSEVMMMIIIYVRLLTCCDMGIKVISRSTIKNSSLIIPNN